MPVVRRSRLLNQSNPIDDPDVIVINPPSNDGNSNRENAITKRSNNNDFKAASNVPTEKQQNFQYVNCNQQGASLAGTSVDNFLVIQSPNYPLNYPILAK